MIIRRFGSFVSVAIAVAAAGPVRAQDVPQAPWKIADIGLGDTPAAVAATLARAGYRRDWQLEGRSWEAEVAAKAAWLRGIHAPPETHVTQNEVYRKDQERLFVDYLATPAGPLLWRIEYRILARLVDEGRFRAAVGQRYGEPRRRWTNELAYCSPAGTSCNLSISPDARQLPTLTVRFNDITDRSIELSHGERAERNYAQAVIQEVDRRYPKKQQPSF
ncbi:MAG TPA: hypothetical protein VGC56_00680 [Allosphingosinicella sp.]|jgi:hypothetical protein